MYPNIYILVIHWLYMEDIINYPKHKWTPPQFKEEKKMPKPKKSKTTILIEKAIVNDLKKCKVYDRETYDDVLKRLIKNKRKSR